MTHIDLFSGIGGFALAAQWAGFKTVAFVEIEPYAQEILKQNFGAMADAADARCNDAGQHDGGSSPLRARLEQCRPRIYGDIRTFDGTRYRGATLLTGGFPCQPFSQAGKRRGKEDDRALWPEMFRVIRESKPNWILAENVPGIIGMELDNVLSDLAGENYATRPLIIPACAVDAQHRRDRIWIVAHSGRFDSERGRCECGGQKESRPCDRVTRSSEYAEFMADAESRRKERQPWSNNSAWPSIKRGSQTLADAEDGGQPMRRRASGNGRHAVWSDMQAEERSGISWLPEPDVGRVANGIPRRVDRLKGLGNAIVPHVAYEILRVIARIEGIKAR